MSYSGTWVGWPAEMDQHPAIDKLRELSECETADAYVARAYLYAKHYEKSGNIEPIGRPAQWEALARFIRWPKFQREKMAEIWKEAGVVVGPQSQLLLWYQLNGWLIERNKEQAKDKRIQRAKKRAEEKRREEANRKRREARAAASADRARGSKPRSDRR